MNFSENSEFLLDVLHSTEGQCLEHWGWKQKTFFHLKHFLRTARKPTFEVNPNSQSIVVLPRNSDLQYQKGQKL